MQYNAALEIFNRILFVSLAIVFLYLGHGLPGLFAISVFSQFFTLIINYRLTKRFLTFKFISKIHWDISLLKSALIFSVLSFAVLLTTRIDIVMISWLTTPKDVGIYGVAYSIVRSGGDVRNLMAIAFFPIFVKIFHNKIVKWSKILRYAFMLGSVVFITSIIVSLFSEQIITFLFGSEYHQSGIILSVLVFFLALNFFSIPFTNSLQATHNEKKILAVIWIGPCINIGLNLLFFNIFGLIGIAYSTLVVTIVTISIYVFITYHTLKKQNKIK
jgi:O-antigen/teichoic acid export membrane protein